MAKFRLAELRQLHSKLGSILEDYDTAKAAESDGKATAGGEDNPPEFPGKPAAMDSAPHTGSTSMYKAFPDLLRLQNR